MDPRLSHQLDAYSKQSGDPRYSVLHLEKFALLILVGLVIISAFYVNSSLLAIPGLCWWAYRRGLFV